jgi:hypothetical protein
MKASAMSRSRTLLDFGAGFLFGLSIIVALFAAMEDDVGPLAHNMLLTALALLGLAIAAKLAARGRSRRRRSAPPAGLPSDASAAETGRTAEGSRDVGATETLIRASSGNDYRASRDERGTAASPKLSAAHRNEETTAEGETRRL